MQMVCIDKSAHVHHKDFGMRTETLYKGWAGRTKTVRKGFVGPVPQNVMCKGSIGPTKAAYKSFESSPRNLRAHKGFVYIKYLWTQSLRALHQVYTQTTPMDTQK